LAARDQHATIVTIPMVFPIQSSQNRDSATVHLELDESEPHGSAVPV